MGEIKIKISEALLKKVELEVAGFLASGMESMELPGEKGFFLATKRLPGMLCIKKIKFNNKFLLICHEK